MRKCSYLSTLLWGVMVIILLCSCKHKVVNARNTDDGKRHIEGKIIVLVGSHVSEEELEGLRKNRFSGSKMIFHRVCSITSEEEYLGELTSMTNRTKQFKKHALEAINQNGWSKDKNEFILLGYQEQGLVVLEVAEELQKEINLSKIIVISAPLCGYDFYNGSYGCGWGAIGQLICGLQQASLGRNSTVVKELTPGSDYLKKLHSFVESQSRFLIYIADASIKKLCTNVENSTISSSTNTDSKKISSCKTVEREVQELFEKVARDIREKYHKMHQRNSTNTKDLPGVEEITNWWKYLESANRTQFYLFFKYLNGGKKHDGLLSIQSQRGNNIKNKHVCRGSFDGYGGTLFIPYKELNNLKPPHLFSEEERTLNNPKLHDELVKFIIFEKRSMCVIQ